MNRLPNYNPSEHTPKPEDATMTRREMLQRGGMGMGALSLAMMLRESVFAGSSAYAAELAKSPVPGTILHQPHFSAKAKHVIHIFANGGPSQVDTFDPKPALARYADTKLPGMNGLAFPTPFKFSACGKSGVEVSEIFPKLGQCIDDMCIIRSMWTDVPAHEPASRMMNTGSLQQVKPSLGSWVLYGLGSENNNIPGFISIGGKADYRAASFLPSQYQGSNVNFSANVSPQDVLLNIRNRFITPEQQRGELDLARKLNALHSEKLQKEEQLEARIDSFEMAFRMQTEATDAFDISKEPQHIRDLYGNKSANGAKLLAARRLVERGVRFVQVSAGGWDHHQNIEQNLRNKASEIDQPAAALLTDLKQRGLLDSTLVIWGGEFGRTVTRDAGGNAQPGRDHNGRGFCTWMAGGGVKGGLAYGATDEFGSTAMDNKVHVHDLHATILALLGFDHKRLTYRYNGRDFRLTDNYGEIVKDIIA